MTVSLQRKPPLLCRVFGHKMQRNGCLPYAGYEAQHAAGKHCAPSMQALAPLAHWDA